MASERAIYGEKTISAERAKAGEKTTPQERAISKEKTNSSERAKDTEKTKSLERLKSICYVKKDIRGDNMNIKTVKINLSEIKLNPDNPRQITPKAMKKLVKSLGEFPEMLSLREIVVDENMMILGGNMRYRALKESGAGEATVKIVAGLTDAQKREFVIKDNGSWGQWDMDLLSHWDDLPLADWGVDLPEEWMKTPDDIDFNNKINFEDDISQIILYCPDSHVAGIKEKLEIIKEEYPGLIVRIKNA